MALLVEDTNDYTPASEGTHIAICCDAEDMGVLDTKDGPVPRLHALSRSATEPFCRTSKKAFLTNKDGPCRTCRTSKPEVWG